MDWRDLLKGASRKEGAAIKERIIREDLGVTAAKSSKEYRNASRQLQLLAKGRNKDTTDKRLAPVVDRLKMEGAKVPPPPVGPVPPPSPGDGGGVVFDPEYIEFAGEVQISSTTRWVSRVVQVADGPGSARLLLRALGFPPDSERRKQLQFEAFTRAWFKAIPAMRIAADWEKSHIAVW